MSIESRPIENPKATNVPSLEDIDQLISSRLKDTVEDLKLIAPALRELAQKIEQEKPDVVIFLDVSARIFGTPYLKHLRERMNDDAPDIRFLNDHLLKARYMTQVDFKETAREEFKNYVGKKVFFVDETYSNGKGAITLIQAAREANVDGYYFAFSTDPAPSDEHKLNDEDRNVIDEAKAAGHVMISENKAANLFSRWASRLYIQDFQGETLPLSRSGQSKVEPVSDHGIPDANSFVRPPEGMTQGEYLRAASEKIDTAVREVKDLIYKTLNASRLELRDSKQPDS